jgi:hypothetical protein
MARFGDGRRESLVRHGETPTHSLHPAADCFRAQGYKVSAAKVQIADVGYCSCFNAAHSGGNHLVCERSNDGQGPDVSAWYRDAVLG